MRAKNRKYLIVIINLYINEKAYMDTNNNFICHK